MRGRPWRDGVLVEQESYTLKSCIYFAQELLLMLAYAGFRDVAVEGNYTGRPATPDDSIFIFVAKS